MAEGFRIATAFVEVVPDTTGFKAKAQSELDAEHLEAKAKVKVDTTDLEKAKLAAQKAALSAAAASLSEATAADKAAAAQKRAADAATRLAASEKASADAQKAAAEASGKLERGEITEAEAAKVAADAADKKAKAEKDAAAAAELSTKADRENERASIAAASAKLKEAEAAKKAAAAQAEAAAAARGGAGSGVGEREERIKVKVDDAGAKEKLAEDKAAADSAGFSFSSLVPKVGLLGGAILGAVAAMPAFGGALGAVAIPMGVLGLALGGVKTALSDYTASVQQAPAAAAQLAATAYSNAVAIRNAEQAIVDAKRSAAEQQITSAEAVRNAEMSLGDAHRQAAQQAISSAESVANAEQALGNAQISEQRAQEDLTLARREATRQLEDLNNAQKDATLGVADAQLALQQAQLEQKRTNQNAMTTALERAQADLAVQKAQQQLVEAQQRQKNATEDANRANKAGVEGSKTVRDAKNAERLALQGIANAQQSLGDAVRNSANSQISSAEAIKRAEQSLTDARRNAALSQITSTEAVRKAVQALADTQREQQLAAVTQGNQAAKAFQLDMSRMSAAGRGLVMQLIDMKDAFHTLSGAAQTALAPGVTKFFQGLQTLLPMVTTEVSQMGKIIGGQFAAIGAFLSQGTIQNQIKAIFDQANKFVAILGPALGHFGASLLELWSKSGAASDGLAKGLAAIVDGFSGLFKALTPAAGAIGTVLQVLGQAIGSLGPPLGQVIAAFAQGLAPILQALLPGFRALAGALGTALAGDLKLIAPVLLMIAKGASALALALSPVISKFGDMEAQLGPKLQPLTTALANAFGKTVTAMRPLFDILPQLVGSVVKFVEVAATPLADLMTQLAPVFADVTKAVVTFVAAAIKPMLPHWAKMAGLFGDVLKALLPLIPPLAKLAGQVLVDLLRAFTPLLPSFERLISQMVIVATKAVTPLLPQIQQLSGQFVQLLIQLMPLLPPLLKLSDLGIQLALKVLPALIPAITLSVKAFAAFVSMSLEVTTGIVKIINWVVKLASEWKRWFGDIWQHMKQWWADLGNLWRTSTDWIYNTLWKGWTTNLWNSATRLWNDLRGSVRTFWSDMQAAFSGGVNALGQIWNRIADMFKAPVNFLINTVYDHGIKTLWDDVVNAIGATGLHLPYVNQLAGGGVLPGYAPGRDTVPALLSPGEAVLVPEAVRAIGPGAINAINAEYGGGRKSSVGRYAGGGIIGDITGGLSSLVKGAGWLADFAVHPVQAVESLLDKVIKTNAHGDYAKAMTGVPHFLIHKLAEWASVNGGGDGAKAVAFARAQLGKPYVWGATGPDSFDCSGLTMRAWEAAGKEIGRTTYDQVNAGRGGDRSTAKPGDIHEPEPGHVMMFVAPRSGGGMEMIHAPHTGTVVQYAPFRGGGVVRLIAGAGGAGPAGSGQSPQAAQGFAQAQLGQFGWSGGEMGPLIQLWNQESGWRWNATNPSSGAYGIPQSLPASKMASAGSDWQTNAFTQIRWGLGYIHDRYGSPSAAESHEQAYNWYDQGGYLPPGMSKVVNATGKPEAVLNPRQTEAIENLAAVMERAFQAPAGQSGTRHVEAHFHGVDPSSPEHLAAVKYALATAVGTA